MPKILVFLGCLALVVMGAMPVPAAPPGVRVDDGVRFANGDVQLAASLYLPAGEGPFPGVVFLQGSGTSGRSNAWTTGYAAGLVARGIAVLHTDKRGSGASGGDWRTASFLDLADDALAGLAYLRGRDEVDATNVGLVGFSQGGRVAAMAAARSADVAFVASIVSSVVPFAEQVEDEIVKMGQRAGLSEEQLDTVRSIHRASLRYVRTGRDWDRYAALLENARKGSMAGLEVVEGFPSDPSSPTWTFARAVGEADPMDDWKRIEVPMLFLLGGRDENIDVAKTVGRIEEVLAPLERNFVLLVMNRDGHGIFRQDALDFMGRWIRDRGGTSSSGRDRR